MSYYDHPPSSFSLSQTPSRSYVQRGDTRSQSVSSQPNHWNDTYPATRRPEIASHSRASPLVTCLDPSAHGRLSELEGKIAESNRICREAIEKADLFERELVIVKQENQTLQQQVIKLQDSQKLAGTPSLSHTSVEERRDNWSSAGNRAPNRTNSGQSAIHADNQLLQKQVADLERECREAKRLLQIRSDELKEAERFLVKWDNTSDDQIVRAIADINSQVAIIASNMSENFPDRRVMKHANGRANNHMQTCIGPDLLRLLPVSNLTDNAILLEWAIQSSLFRHIFVAFSWWQDGNGEKLGLLSDIHARLLRNELQSVSARWRSLAYRYVSWEGSDIKSRVHRSVTTCIEDIASLFQFAGLAGNRQAIEADCEKVFGKSITALWTATFELVQKLQQEVISSDFRVLSVSPGQAFNPMQMEAPLTPQGPNSKQSRGGGRQSVLCTMSLGLLRVSQPAQGNEKEIGKLNETVVLKPGVIMMSDLDVVMPHFESKVTFKATSKTIYTPPVQTRPPGPSSRRFKDVYPPEPVPRSEPPAGHEQLRSSPISLPAILEEPDQKPPRPPRKSTTLPVTSLSRYTEHGGSDIPSHYAEILSPQYESGKVSSGTQSLMAGVKKIKENVMSLRPHQTRAAVKRKKTNSNLKLKIQKSRKV